MVWLLLINVLLINKANQDTLKIKLVELINKLNLVLFLDKTKALT